jgi:hypothetical protein
VSSDQTFSSQDAFFAEVLKAFTSKRRTDCFSQSRMEHPPIAGSRFAATCDEKAAAEEAQNSTAACTTSTNRSGLSGHFRNTLHTILYFKQRCKRPLSMVHKIYDRV